MTTRRALLPAVALLSVVSGLVAQRSSGSAANAVWMAGLVLAGGPLVVQTLVALARGRFASDVVASLAIVGAILVGLPLAGLVVALMQSGGEALEEYAVATREQGAPRPRGGGAPRHPSGRGGGSPRCDGGFGATRRSHHRPAGRDATVRWRRRGGDAAVDLARVSGEPVPLHAFPGMAVRSGGIVLDGPLRVRVTARAEESLYAGIVALVRRCPGEPGAIPAARRSRGGMVHAAHTGRVRRGVAHLPRCHPGARDPGGGYALSAHPGRASSIRGRHQPGRGARHRRSTRRGPGGSGHRRHCCRGQDRHRDPGLAALVRVDPAPELDARILLALVAEVEANVGHPMARAVVEAAGMRGLTPGTATGVRESPGRGVSGHSSRTSRRGGLAVAGGGVAAPGRAIRKWRRPRWTGSRRRRAGW